MLTLIPILVAVGWSASFMMIEDKYSIVSIISIGNIRQRDANADLIIEKAKTSTVTWLSESTGEQADKLARDLVISNKRGSLLITLRSRFIEPSKELHQTAHDVVVHNIVSEIMDSPSQQIVDLRSKLKSVRMELSELRMPSYLKQKTLDLGEKLAAERDLIRPIADEENRIQKMAQIKREIDAFSAVNAAFIAANSSLKAELESLLDSQEGSTRHADILVALARNLQSISELTDRIRRLENNLYVNDKEIERRLQHHLERASALEQLIEFERIRLENEIRARENTAGEMKNLISSYEPEIISLGQISAKPVGLTKRKAFILSLPVAIAIALTVVMVMSFAGKIKSNGQREISG